LLQFTVLLDFMVLAPLGDVLMKSLSIGPAPFSLVVSAYAFSAGVSGLLPAGFADHFDHKRLLLFYAGFTLGTLGCAMADNYGLLLLARVVAGLFGGIIGAIVLTIVADEFGEQQRGRAMGLMQLAASQVAGVPLSLWLSSRWNWHAPFALLVAIALLAGAGVLRWLRPLRRHFKLQVHTNPLTHLGHILRRPAYQLGLLTMLLLTVGGGLLSPFGSAFLVCWATPRPWPL
jgi:predicted MFS family arabinose efflux permease